MTQREPPMPKKKGGLLREPPQPKQGLSNIQYQAPTNPMGMGGGLMGQMGQQEVTQEQVQETLKNMTDDQFLQLVENNPQLKQEYEKLVKQQAGQFQGKSKPVTSEEYKKIKKMEEYLDKEDGITIEPDKGFVFKSFDIKTKEKFFINVVHHPAIDEPEQKYLVDFENQPGLRIPLSLGVLKEDHDKKNDICKVCDAVLNPNIIDAVNKDESMKQFLIEILKGYILEKYKIELDFKFTTPKLQYKGQSIEFQRVKGKRAPKIQQISEEEIKSNNEQIQKSGQKLIKEYTSANQRNDLLPYYKNFLKLKSEFLPRPIWQLYMCYPQKQEIYDGDFEIKKINHCRFFIELPLLITGKHILLNISSSDFQLKVKKMYELILKFPFKIEILTVKSRFCLQTRSLEILAKPYKKQETLIEIEKEQNYGQIQQVDNKIDINLQNNLLDDLV